MLPILLSLFGCSAPVATEPPVFAAALTDQNALHSFNVFRVYLYNETNGLSRGNLVCGRHWPATVVVRARADGWMAIDADTVRWLWNGTRVTKHDPRFEPIPPAEVIAEGQQITALMTAVFQTFRTAQWKLRSPSYYGLSKQDEWGTVEIPAPPELPGVHLFIHYSATKINNVATPSVLSDIALFLPDCGSSNRVEYAVHRYDVNPTLPPGAWSPTTQRFGVYFPKTCGIPGMTECPDQPDIY